MNAPTPPAAPRRAPRWRRRAAAALLAGVALLGAGAGALAWLGSAGGVSWWAARWAPAGTQLQLDGVAGSLWSRLHVDRLRVADASTELRADDLTLSWSPRALWRGRLHVLRLRAARVELLAHGTAALTAPPRSLRLPLRVDVDHVEIGALALGSGGDAHALGRWRGALHYAAARWRVSVDAATRWGEARANGTLSDAPPYALDFDAKLVRLAADPTAHAELHGTGALAALTLHGALQAATGRARLAATVHPFAALPLADATLSADALDPASLDPALPHAALDLRVALAASSLAQLRGSLVLRNRSPGAPRQHRLPLRTLRAELRGDADALELSAIDADFGAAGRLRGRARWHGDALRAWLQAEAIDAHAIDPRLYPTRLAGPLEFAIDGARQTLQLRLAQPGWSLAAHVERDASALTLSRIELRAPGGALQADARLGRDQRQAFTVQARLRDIDPSRFGRWPRARIGATLRADGSLAERRANVVLTLLDGSRWRGRALTGHLALISAGRRLHDIDAALGVGDDRLRVLGAFGGPDDRLRWRVDAPSLTQLDAQATGSVHGHGELSGGTQAPQTTLQLQLRALRWQTLRVARLDADGALRLTGDATPRSMADAVARLDGELMLRLDALHWSLADTRLAIDSATLRARGQVRGALQLDGELHNARLANTSVAARRVELNAATLRVDGSAASQRIALQARGTLASDHRVLPLQLEFGASGGWNTNRWSGRVEQLDNADPRAALHLLAPAGLVLRTEPDASLQVSHASLRVGDGALDIAELAVGRGVLATRGTLRQLDSGPLLPLLGVPGDALRSTLRLSGEWDFDLGRQARGQLQLQRDDGDLTLEPSTQPLPLAIEQLQLELQLLDGRLDGRGVLLSRLGSMQFSGGFALQRHGAGWGLATDAPLRLDAGVDLPQLDWTTPLLGPELQLRGHLRLAVHGRGSIDQPKFTGRIDAEALKLRWLTEGLDLRDGVLAAHFDGDRIELDHCLLHGGDGTLQLSGAAQLRDGAVGGQFTAHAARLQVLDSPDRQLVLDGDARAVLAERTVSISGALRAVRADFALHQAVDATLSRDIVVLGRKPTPPAPLKPAALPTRVHIDGSFDFGDAFRVHGLGVDAELSGRLQLHGDAGSTVRGNGTLEVKRGVYTAYGQNLRITSGRVNFNGPLDDPGLNIDATRPDLPTGVVVGVHLGGSALHPQARLNSDPAMPDTEILSWLTLGEPIDRASASDIGVLQTAAGALLGSTDSVPLQTRLAQALGLDNIAVDSTTTASGTQQSLVTISKRLSSKLKVGFSRGIDGVASIFSVQYELAHRLSLRTRAGTENAVDVFYSFDFD